MQNNNQLILTKIVATIGPACSDVKTLVRMIEEGVRVVRINFSHGDFKQFKESLDNVRQAGQKTNIPVGVLGDLRGPKLRAGLVEENGLQLKAGDTVRIVENDITGHFDKSLEQVVISTSYPKIVEEVEPGQRVLINDGAIRLLATERSVQENKRYLLCSVTTPGKLTSNKGINLPDTHITADSLTDYDKKCIDWAMEHKLDFLALSFVRSKEDVSKLKEILKNSCNPKSAPIPIVAKIETPQAVKDIDAISQVSDGLMVARGDLGVEMDVAKVPIVQKQIIKAAHARGKPVIVATQMLQSMIDQPIPTRAEVSDVANAIIDGTDAVMLSGETAVGKYPVQTVSAMAHTASITEGFAIAEQHKTAEPPHYLKKKKYHTAALAHGVSAAATDIGCKCAVIWSQRGGGARFLSQHRLPVPVIAVSSNEAALRRMGILFGVRPVLMQPPETIAKFADQIDELLIEKRWAKRSDALVMMCGKPLGAAGVTNRLIIHYVKRVCELANN